MEKSVVCLKEKLEKYKKNTDCDGKHWWIVFGLQNNFLIKDVIKTVFEIIEKTAK